MNIHKPLNFDTDWISLEFRGKPFISNSLKFIRIIEKGTGKSGFYCYNKNVVYMGMRHRIKEDSFQDIIKSFD